jgi:microcompartment protein CcmK/EutM
VPNWGHTHEDLSGGRDLGLLVVKERGSSGKQVAVDPVGCKPGDWVIAVGSSAARDAAGSKDYPSDLTIVGIIDYWDDSSGKAGAQ